MLVEIRQINKIESTVVTSLDVAETFGKEHRRVMQDIRELECSDDFRLHGFVQSYYWDSQNHKRPMYYMNRDGFTMLVMGYTGKTAAQFKENYIRQFNAMEKALQDKIIEREKGIVIRQSFTKALQQSGENDRMHGHAYSTYTNLVYKTVFGKNSKQLKEEFGLGKKDNLRNCFSQEELAKVKSVEMVINGLVECGWGYSEIKEFVENSQKKLLPEYEDLSA